MRCSLLVVGCWLLFAVICCSLSVVRCVWFAVCCSLLIGSCSAVVVCCVLFIVRKVLFVVRRCSLFAMRGLAVLRVEWCSL